MRSVRKMFAWLPLWVLILLAGGCDLDGFLSKKFWPELYIFYPKGQLEKIYVTYKSAEFSFSSENSYGKEISGEYEVEFSNLKTAFPSASLWKVKNEYGFGKYFYFPTKLFDLDDLDNVTCELTLVIQEKGQEEKSFLGTVHLEGKLKQGSFDSHGVYKDVTLTSAGGEVIVGLFTYYLITSI